MDCNPSSFIARKPSASHPSSCRCSGCLWSWTVFSGSLWRRPLVHRLRHAGRGSTRLVISVASGLAAAVFAGHLGVREMAFQVPPERSARSRLGLYSAHRAEKWIRFVALERCALRASGDIGLNLQKRVHFWVRCSSLLNLTGTGRGKSCASLSSWISASRCRPITSR